MDADRAAVWTGGTAFAQRTGGTRLNWKVYHPSGDKRHFLLVGTTQPLPLPIQLKGRFREARSIAHGPGLAIHLQVSSTLSYQRATEVGSIDMQFAQSDLLASQIRMDRFRHAGFGRIGRRDPDGSHQSAVQITQDMPFVAIHPHTAAFASMAHLRIFDRDAPIFGHPLP